MLFLNGKEMDTVMMKTIMQDVTMMEETVAETMSTRLIAANVNVLNLPNQVSRVDVNMAFCTKCQYLISNDTNLILSD